MWTRYLSQVDIRVQTIIPDLALSSDYFMCFMKNCESILYSHFTLKIIFTLPKKTGI